jgi:putative membrane protein
MTGLTRLLKWLLYGAIFFTCFAFALNNQQDATLRFFFGTQWRMPMALVVLAAFAVGLGVGILAMVPRWWNHRIALKRLSGNNPSGTSPASTARAPDYEP